MSDTDEKEAFEFLEPGTFRVTGAPVMRMRTREPTFSPCCVVFDDRVGQPAYFPAHEPDLRLEERMPVRGAKFITFFDEADQVMAYVRFCKRCRCLYVEDVKGQYDDQTESGDR